MSEGPPPGPPAARVVQAITQTARSGRLQLRGMVRPGGQEAVRARRRSLAPPPPRRGIGQWRRAVMARAPPLAQMELHAAVGEEVAVTCRRQWSSRNELICTLCGMSSRKKDERIVLSAVYLACVRIRHGNQSHIPAVFGAPTRSPRCRGRRCPSAVAVVAAALAPPCPLPLPLRRAPSDARLSTLVFSLVVFHTCSSRSPPHPQ